MDFKFSCKWFEVSFSGDPGFVETQISKYEPHIMKVLEKIDGPGRDTPEPDPQQDPSRYHQRENNYDRDRSRKDRRRHGGAERKHRMGAGDSLPRYQSRSAEFDSDKDDGGQGQARPEPETETPSPARADYAGTKPEPSSGKNGQAMEQEADKQQPAKDKPAPEKPKAPAPEFAARRKAPSIKSESLMKLIDDKRPRTHHDRIMVFGYYMENDGGGTDFTIAEIKRCYRAASQDPGVNIEQVINHASRSGFVVRNDSGRTTRYKLSSKGKGYVEDGLKLS